MVERTDVVVIGGGLAGLTAAAYLSAERRVTLIESTDTAGGQCGGECSGNGARDFGVHGIYPRYTELTALLRMAGVREHDLVRAGDQYIVTPHGRPCRVHLPAIPAPLHVLVHALRLGEIGLRERAQLLSSSAKLLALSADCPNLDVMSIREMAANLRVPPAAFRLVFEPLAWIGFFLHPETLSARAYLAAMRFLITGRSDSWRARWIPPPNGKTLIRPLVDLIERNRGRVLVHTKAVALQEDGKRVSAVKAQASNGELTIHADSFICAVPPQQAASLVETLNNKVCSRALGRLGSTYVRTFRFHFSPGPTPPVLHGVVLTDAAGFVFFSLRDLMPVYAEQESRVIEVQCGPDLMDAGAVMLESSVRRLLPDGTAAKLLKVDETPTIPYARYAVGGAANRPGIQSSWPNLFFAGDWVEEPSGSWFMERAATTGHLSANAVLRREDGFRPWHSLEGVGVRTVRRLVSRAMQPVLYRNEQRRSDTSASRSLSLERDLVAVESRTNLET